MAFSVASTSAVAPRRAVARAAAPQKAAQQPVGRREAAQLAAAALGLALGARPANALPKKAQVRARGRRGGGGGPPTRMRPPAAPEGGAAGGGGRASAPSPCAALPPESATLGWRFPGSCGARGAC